MKIVRISTLSTVLFLCSVTAVFALDGLISVKSPHSVIETASRLESLLTSKGMTIFIRIDHSEGAKKAGKELRPTQVVIFGNPKVGTPLMQCAQSAAIDLPQKALIWQDGDGQVWYTYNDPRYVAKRHDVRGCEEEISKIEKALANFASGATAP